MASGSKIYSMVQSKTMIMEKPNPELYNSQGHYEADLEKYNEMKNMSAEDILKKHLLPLYGNSEEELDNALCNHYEEITAAMEEYTQFKAEPSQCAVSDEEIRKLVVGILVENDVNIMDLEDNYQSVLVKTYAKSVKAGIEIFKAALRKQVWDK